jgi:hypothetical protein
VRGVREGEVVGDLVDRLVGEDELALRLGQHALADEVAGGDAGGALDVIVEAVRRHGKLAGVERELALLAEMLLDQVAFPSRLLSRCESDILDNHEQVPRIGRGRREAKVPVERNGAIILGVNGECAHADHVGNLERPTERVE